MSEPADVIAALKAIVAGDAGVSALVSTRVYGGEIPDTENENMPQPAVVLNAAGGGLLGNAFQDYGDRRIDTHCYGATPHQAELVHLAVRAVMKSIDRQLSEGVLVHWARAVADGAGMRDPVKTWPVCLASYQVLAAEITAS